MEKGRTLIGKKGVLSFLCSLLLKEQNENVEKKEKG